MTQKTSSRSTLTVSVISLVLCFVMLLGTTFAWWSTSVSSAVNTVKSGDLKVDLVDVADATLVGKTLKFVDAETNEVIEDALWEPGCSYALQSIYLKNTGTVDIKYKINVIGVNGDEGLLKAIDWTVNGQAATEFTGTLASGETSGAIDLAGSMKTSAGNQYMDLTADGIAIAVYATQIGADEFEEVVALIKELDADTIDDVDLDAAFTFTPVPGAPEEKYSDWNADYVVSFNQAVAPNAILLAGQYQAYNNGEWVTFQNGEEIAEGAEIRLLESMGYNVKYSECCELVKEFNCGAASDVSGLTMTVELRLYERVGGVETGEYVTAASYTYAF